MRLCSRFGLFLWLTISALHCDRGVEPFDASEEPRRPDLSRIFPEAAKETPPGEPSGVMGGAAGPRRGAMPAAGEGPAPAVAATGQTIRGTVEIADSLYGERPANGVLFIIARSRPAGPPLAVLLVPSARFPYSFEIGQEHVMIPSLVFEGEIRLSARLDSDGNAMTKLPGDLVGEVPTPIGPGADGVALVLDERLPDQPI